MARRRYVIGQDELIRRLKALPPEIRAATIPAVRANAEEMTGMMTRIVPAETGTLRRSIRIETVDDLKLKVMAGGPETMVEIRKGSGKKWDYALGVEFGVAAHKAGGFFKGANIPAIPLRPFFWPVYRLAKRFYKRRIGDAMKRAIRKTVQS